MAESSAERQNRREREERVGIPVSVYEEAARLKQQRDRLLEAIQDHRAACEYTAPSQYVRQDRSLYKLAQEIEAAKGGSDGANQ